MSGSACIEARADSEQLTGGRLNWAIANAAVRVHSRYLGRGPTKARAFHRENVVVVLLHESLTRSERSLAAAGNLDEVRRIRREFTQLMRHALVAEVESLTSRRVVAFMADSSVEPDLGADLFVLDRPVMGNVA